MSKLDQNQTKQTIKEMAIQMQFHHNVTQMFYKNQEVKNLLLDISHGNVIEPCHLQEKTNFLQHSKCSGGKISFTA